MACNMRDETDQFVPKWNADGLMPAITVDDATGEVLMLAYVNEEALAKTLETKRVHYWSRSRGALWAKGETSGHTQALVSAAIDCDQDTLLFRVQQTGPACHTGRKSCFYRTLSTADDTSSGALKLEFTSPR